jgi:hypothetical protein
LYCHLYSENEIRKRRTIVKNPMFLIVISAVMGIFSGTAYPLPYSFTPIEVPGATSTFALGTSGSSIVGSFYEGSNANASEGFFYNGTSYTTLVVPGATSTFASGISGGNIVGTYFDSGGQHGFLYNSTSYTTLAVPGAISTSASGISGSNIVGTYNNGNGFQGFLYNGTSYTTMPAVPLAIGSSAGGLGFNGIDGSKIVGTVGHSGFLYDGSSYLAITVPGAVNTFALGISGSKIVGYYDGPTTQGFLFNGKTYSTIDFPGAYRTFLTGISGDSIVGYYTDFSFNSVGSFLATPINVPEPSTLLLLGCGLVMLEAWRRKQLAR